MGHLLKGFRHPTPTTVSRTGRILTMLLGIVAKPTKKDKFEVTKESVAYLSALVSVSEEVRSRCHVRHHMSRHLASSNDNMNWSPKSPTNRRQKSWDLLDQNALAQAQRQQVKQTTVQQVSNVKASRLFFISLYFFTTIYSLKSNTNNHYPASF